MFEDLIEKLKASIEELKKKLPGRGGDDDDEEYEDVDEDDEYEDKYHGDDEDEDDGKTVKVQVTDLLQEGIIKDKTQKIKPGDEPDEEDDDEDDDDEDEESDEEKAQKKKKLLTYGAVFAIVVLVGWDYIFPPEPEVPAPVQRPKKKKKRKKRKFPKKKEATAATEVKKEVKKEPEAVAPKVEVKVADVPPETATGLPEKAEEAPKVAEPAPVVDPEPKIVEPVPTVESEPVKEEAVAKEVQNIDLKMGESKPKETAKEMATEGTQNTEMTSKIEKKLEYVAPPNYERSGRGLVYNCVGKHWACVDKFSYLTCRENTVWSKQNAKKPECVIKNVYLSTDDCGVIQKHYIESSEATTFCDGVEKSATTEDASSTDAIDTSSSEGEDDLDLLE